MMTPNVSIVLVEPSHPGNVGAAARAMKTMNISRLVLVSPRYASSDEAVARAAHATDILEQAVVVDNLADALSECQWVVGTSTRERGLSQTLYTSREAVAKTFSLAQQSAQKLRVAWVFGRENSGLSNDELAMCNAHAMIPANPDYSSLNLACAVQVICYEWYMATLSGATTHFDSSIDVLKNAQAHLLNSPKANERLATHKELQGLFMHANQSLQALGVLNPKAPRKLMARLQRLILRGRAEIAEVNLLRGILTSIDNLKKSISADDKGEK